MRAAHRAVGILAQLELAEFHSQCIKEQQAANEMVAAAENQFDRFHGLNGTDNSRQNAKHSTLSARRHETWRRRLRIEAAVAWAIRHAKDRDLPFETENRAVNVGLAEKNARVVYKIACREIVRAVHDDVEVLE